jgi:dienelactone hydrolase
MVEHESSSFEMGGQKYPIDRYAAKNGSAKRSIVIVLHGVDGMGGESGTEIRKFAEQIADAGFLVFVPHYFDAADGADSLPLEQLFFRRVPRVGSYPPRIAAAIDHVLQQSGGDGELGLVGLSLGGGLAIDYAQSISSGEVRALVDYFGYISDPKLYANAGRLPPTLILHNNADEIVKIRESSKPLLEALGRTAVVHDHCFYDDANPARGNHPFLPGGPADVDSRSRSVAWLKTYLKSSS